MSAWIKSILLLTLLLSACHPYRSKISGTMKVWHKVVMDFKGPTSGENSSPNPFTDYRADITFTGPANQIYKVPGYFAADGHAAETGASSGNVWRVNFTPDQAGHWSFAAAFVRGKDVAAELTGGKSAGYFDGQTGSFDVAANDNADTKDFRSKGKLIYVGEHYLQFQGSREYFLKGGANSPEVFLEYKDFDNTPSDRDYAPHIRHWKEGDPVWHNGKGKGIIGAVNYLSDAGINAIYFMTMNAYGDGKKAWPWIHQDSVTVYDCSKLDQWDIVFSHMIKKGVMPHFVLTETENESYFEVKENGSAGGFAVSRKIYYREMIARFGYLAALTWNIGEENGWSDGTGYYTGNTDEQRRQFSDRIRQLACYRDHIAIHNGPSTDDHIYNQLLSVESLTGAALQWNYGPEVHAKVLEWRNKSEAAGKKWVVSMDEPWINDPTGTVDTWRTEMVWGSYMAGGAGIELYVGGGLDLLIQDYSVYAPYYHAIATAQNFFVTHVPFCEMEPDDDFAANAWSLCKADSIYLLYLKNGGTTSVNLPSGKFSVKWFDPRKGGTPGDGTITELDGNSLVSIGVPPYDQNKDWACLIVKK
jgi:hypothetical protein